jgi:hypothetical protein
VTGDSQPAVSAIAVLHEHARQCRALAAEYQELLDGVLADAQVFEEAATRLSARRDAPAVSEPAGLRPPVPGTWRREPATQDGLRSAASDDSPRSRLAATITTDPPSTTTKLLELMAADPDQSWTPAEAAARVGHPKPESVRKLLSLQVQRHRLTRTDGRYQWATRAAPAAEPTEPAAAKEAQLSA